MPQSAGGTPCRRHRRVGRPCHRVEVVAVPLCWIRSCFAANSLVNLRNSMWYEGVCIRWAKHITVKMIIMDTKNPQHDVENDAAEGNMRFPRESRVGAVDEAVWTGFPSL